MPIIARDRAVRRDFPEIDAEIKASAAKIATRHKTDLEPAAWGWSR